MCYKIELYLHWQTGKKLYIKCCHFQWPLTQISRACHYSTLNVWETIQDRDIVRLFEFEFVSVLPSANSVCCTVYHKLLQCNAVQSIEWCTFQWPWMTPNPNFMPLIDAEYLRKGARYRHSYNVILMGLYTCPSQGCHFKWSWIGKIFIDMEHHTVSLKQLSFL